MLRNKFVGTKLKRKSRHPKNPSMALSKCDHDLVHGEEIKLRATLGLNPNEMMKSARAEIRLLNQAAYNALVSKGKITIQQLRIHRKLTIKFVKTYRL